jgi:hypothetical protein
MSTAANVRLGRDLAPRLVTIRMRLPLTLSIHNHDARAVMIRKSAGKWECVRPDSKLSGCAQTCTENHMVDAGAPSAGEQRVVRSASHAPKMPCGEHLAQDCLPLARPDWSICIEFLVEVT